MTFRPANFDPSIDPTADRVRALRDAGPDGQVVMLNLLKFREQANEPAGSPHPPGSRAEAYRRYQTAVRRVRRARLLVASRSRQACRTRRTGQGDLRQANTPRQSRRQLRQ
jgi:hypothetical protein